MVSDAKIVLMPPSAFDEMMPELVTVALLPGPTRFKPRAEIAANAPEIVAPALLVTKTLPFSV